MRDLRALLLVQTAQLNILKAVSWVLGGVCGGNGDGSICSCSIAAGIGDGAGIGWVAVTASSGSMSGGGGQQQLQRRRHRQPSWCCWRGQPEQGWWWQRWRWQLHLSWQWWWWWRWQWGPRQLTGEGRKKANLSLTLPQELYFVVPPLSLSCAFSRWGEQWQWVGWWTLCWWVPRRRGWWFAGSNLCGDFTLAAAFVVAAWLRQWLRLWCQLLL